MQATRERAWQRKVYGRVSAVLLTFALQGLCKQDLLTGEKLDHLVNIIKTEVKLVDVVFLGKRIHVHVGLTHVG